MHQPDTRPLSSYYSNDDCCNNVGIMQHGNVEQYC